MCALLERLPVFRNEMIVLGRVPCIIACVLMFLVGCKAPGSVEYVDPTSCSSDEFYQISNLSCVDCATNQVKASNGM